MCSFKLVVGVNITSRFVPFYYFFCCCCFPTQTKEKWQSLWLTFCAACTYTFCGIRLMNFHCVTAVVIVSRNTISIYVIFQSVATKTTSQSLYNFKYTRHHEMSILKTKSIDGLCSLIYVFCVSFFFTTAILLQTFTFVRFISYF